MIVLEHITLGVSMVILKTHGFTHVEMFIKNLTSIMEFKFNELCHNMLMGISKNEVHKTTAV